LAHLSGRDSDIIPYMSPFISKLFAPKRIYIVLGIFVAANILASFKIATDTRFFNSGDFIAYSFGAKMVLDGQGQNLYDLRLQTTYVDMFLKDRYPQRENEYIAPFLAPPTTALIYIPYLLLPHSIRAPVATLINFLLILTGILVIGKAIQNKKLAFLAVFSSWFVWVCVWQIQPTALLFLVTSLLYVSLTKKNYALAGVLCAFYIIKPQYLIITPFIFLLTEKSVTFFKAFLASILLLLIVNVSITGPHTLFVDYPKFLDITDNPSYGNRWFEMYSVQQITYGFSRFLVDSKIPPLIVGAIFYLWGLFKIHKLVNSKKTALELFPVVIIITVLSAYHTLSQDLSLMAIGIAILINRYALEKKLLATWGLVGLLLLGIGTESAKISNYYGILYLLLCVILLRNDGVKLSRRSLLHKQSRKFA